MNFTPAADRRWERFDASFEGRLSGRVWRSDCKRNCKRTAYDGPSRGISDRP